MAGIQFSYTHLFNSNDLLGNSNCLGIHASCMIIILYYSLFIDYIELQHSIAAPFYQFYAYFPIFFVRLCFQFLDNCDKLMWYQSCQFHCSTILPILCIFVCIICEIVFSVPRPLRQINTFDPFFSALVTLHHSIIREYKRFPW